MAFSLLANYASSASASKMCLHALKGQNEIQSESIVQDLLASRSDLRQQRLFQ